MADETPLLEVDNLTTTFPLKSGLLRRTYAEVQAVSDVSFAVQPGETLGLVGESGCGKSTVARTVVGLETVKSGHVRFQGRELTSLPRKEMRAVRRDVQLIFQDPYSSLHPGMTVRELVTEPWKIHPDVVPKQHWETELATLLEMVGLQHEHADRYPRQFSGGQQQRISIARALALRPKLLVCDEAVSALDVSIQAQILNLLQDLQDELGLAYLFISHDLSVMRYLCDRIAVMYLGRIVETGERESVFRHPSHPYTQALLSSAPVLEPWLASERRSVEMHGEIPSPADPPSGCRFRTRCWKATDLCAAEQPDLATRGTAHPVACHYPEALPDLVPQSPGTAAT